MMQQAHPVGFGIANADRDFAAQHASLQVSSGSRQSAVAVGTDSRSRQNYLTTATADWLSNRSCPVERIINQQGATEQQALRNQAPGAAIGAGGAIVSQAQVMAGLDVHGLEIQFTQGAPGVGIGPIVEI